MDEYDIEEGYHSFINKEITFNPATTFYYIGGNIEIILIDDWCLFHAVIPKGTKYYLNENGQYVSESLRIIRQYDDEEIVKDLSSLQVLVSPNIVKNYNDCTKDEIKNAIGIGVDDNEINDYRFLMINTQPLVLEEKELNKSTNLHGNSSRIHNGIKYLLKRYFDYEAPEYVWIDENFGWLSYTDYRLENIKLSQTVESMENIKGWVPSFCNKQAEVWHKDK